MRRVLIILVGITSFLLSACVESNRDTTGVVVDYELSSDQTHNRWSSTIEPVLTVPSGSAIVPGFGFLSDEFTEPYLKTFELGKDRKTAKFSENIEIPLKPFPGVMGVAPDTEEMLSTIPPRKNGGNMDDPNMTEGTVVYFPVLVEGALFSIGDTHAAQGHGEVCGTAIEAPMSIIYEVELIKEGKTISEPQYETEDYYAVTAFATTIDEAAKKATGFMIDYLVEEKGMNRQDAYALCSLAGDLKIAEVVDGPHMLVSMHMPKDIFK